MSLSKQQNSFADRVKKMVLIPEGFYEQVKHLVKEQDGKYVFDNIKNNESYDKGENSGNKENDYKSDDINAKDYQKDFNRLEDNKYDLLLEKKKNLFDELASDSVGKEFKTGLIWQKGSKLLTRLQINRLVRSHVKKIEKLGRNRFSDLFRRSKVLSNHFSDMDFNTTYSSASEYKKDMAENNLPPYAPDKKEAIFPNQQLPVLRTKEAEQTKPIVEPIKDVNAIKENKLDTNMNKIVKKRSKVS